MCLLGGAQQKQTNKQTNKYTVYTRLGWAWPVSYSDRDFDSCVQEQSRDSQKHKNITISGTLYANELLNMLTDRLTNSLMNRLA